MISDYSSIWYDYLLLPNKGVIHYDFDVDSYAKTNSDSFVTIRHLHQEYMLQILSNC